MQMFTLPLFQSLCSDLAQRCRKCPGGTAGAASAWWLSGALRARAETPALGSAGPGVSLPGAPFAQALLSKAPRSAAGLAPGKPLHPTSEPAPGAPGPRVGPPLGERVHMAVPRVPAGPALLLSLFQACWCGLSGTAAHSESVPDLVLEETGPLLGLGSFKWARVRVLCISAFSFT